MLEHVDTAIAVLSLTALVFEVAYRRWERLYLAVRRLILWTTNPSTQWNVEVDYAGEFRASDVDRVSLLLQERYGHGRLLAEDTTGRTLQLDGMVVRISLVAAFDHDKVEHDHVHDLVLRFSDVRTTYRGAKGLADGIASLLDQAERLIEPEATKFSATVEFEDLNPYFGLYVQRLRRDTVRSFQCTLSPDGEQGEDPSTVVVGLKQVAVSSRNASDWLRLSKRYLAVR